MILPAAAFIARLSVGHIGVCQRQHRAAVHFFKSHRDDRVFVIVGELGCAPRLHDAFARNELEVAAVDVATPGGDLGADFVRHGRGATGHFGMPDRVEPRIIDLLCGRGDDGAKRKIVRHVRLPGRCAAKQVDRKLFDYGLQCAHRTARLIR